MTFANNLKGQLIDFVDSYKQYFSRTFGTALTFTIVCIAATTLLVKYSDFPPNITSQQISIVNYFFNRFSNGETYCLADLTKLIFIFFVSIFSIGLTRITATEAEEKELGFSSFLRAITLKDFVSLISVLIVTALIDFAITRLYSYSSSNILRDQYLHDTFFQLRIYVPLILFALTCHSLTTTNKSRIGFKRIAFLFFSLWLFNEFAYETSVWMRIHVFNLLLLPVEDPEKFYFIESFLCIPLIAFFFTGFHSAMRTTLKQTEIQHKIITDEKPG